MLLVQIFKQQFTESIVCGLKKAENLLKKAEKFNDKKRQQIFFKHALRKKSLDCSEKSLDR